MASTPSRTLSKSSSIETTGGFTTREGKSVLVTPSGEIVGSAFVSGGGGGGGGQSAQPTTPPPQKFITSIVEDKAVAEQQAERFVRARLATRGRQQAFDRLEQGRELTPVDEFNIRKTFSEAGGFKGGLDPAVLKRPILDLYNKAIETQEKALSLGVRTETIPRLDITKKELPFEKITRVIPETAGRLTTGILRRAGIKGDVIIPETEIFLRQTISPGRTGKIFFKGSKQPISEAFGETIQKITAIGQFAIPYVGQALFLATLAERPILAPEQFKQEFKESPNKMAVLYSLGLVGVSGGINRAIKGIDRITFNNAIKNAKTQFIAKADDETLSILANTRIRNKNFLSRTVIKKVEEQGENIFARGIDITFNIPKKEKIEALISQVFTKGKTLESFEAKRVFPIPKEFRPKEIAGFPIKKLEITKGIKGIPFEVLGVASRRLKILYNTRTGLKIPSGRLITVADSIEEVAVVNPRLIKSQVVGVVSPTKIEDLFKIIAGSKKLRIYKSGGISYVFDPKISGWLKILPEKSFFGVGKDVVLKKLILQSTAAVGLQRKFAQEQAKQLLKQKIGAISPKLGVISKTGLVLKEKKIKEASFKQITTPITKSIQKVNVIPLSISQEKQKIGIIQKQELIQQERQKQKAIPLAITGIKGVFKQKGGLIKLLKFKQIQPQKLKQFPRDPFGIKLIPKPIKFRIPKFPLIPKLDKGLKITRPTIIPRREGYLVFYKTKKKFTQINKIPLTKQQALDLGGEVADRSLANTIKLKKIFRKPQNPEFNIKRGYFASAQAKFRDYQIRKGKRIPLKDIYIEKRGPARIDTPTEKQKIQAAAYIARLRKKKFGIPIKKGIRIKTGISGFGKIKQMSFGRL